MNLLTCYGIQKKQREVTTEALQTLLKEVQKDPKQILKYTGLGTGSENEKIAEQVQKDKENELREQNNTVGQGKSIVESARSNRGPSKVGSKVGNSEIGSEKNSAMRSW